VIGFPGDAEIEIRASIRARARIFIRNFFIGAHAAVLILDLLTRDVSKYRSYFPTVKLIAP